MRFFHHCSVIVAMAALLVACDSGTSSDTEGPSPPSATPSMNELMSPDAGIFRLRHGSPFARERLEYLAFIGDSSDAYNFDPTNRTVTRSHTSDLSTFWVLDDQGQWQSRSWREETAEIRRSSTGDYLHEQWTGATAKISVDAAEDLSNKPMAQHLPALAMLRSGVTIDNDAVFAPGSQRLILRGEVVSDTYTLFGEAWGQTTLDAWLTLAAGAQGRIDDSYPDLDGVTADAVEGSYVTSEGKSGTWKKLSLHGAEMIVLLGGSPQNRFFKVNAYGGHPLLAMHNGALMEGMFIPAGAEAYHADSISALAAHNQMDFNKTALDSIVAQLKPGAFYGFGTPAHAATVLNEAVNTMGVDNGNAFVDRLQLLEGRLSSTRFLMDFDAASFSWQPNWPMPRHLILNINGNWSAAADYSEASVSDDGILLQSDASWTGGHRMTTFRTLDISQHAMTDYAPLVDHYALTALDQGYFEFAAPNHQFRAGAKFVSWQSVQLSAAYQLMTDGEPTGFSSLGSLINNTSVTTWVGGRLRVLEFPPLAGPNSMGQVKVLGAGSVLYGTATWEAKRVGNTDMIIVSNMPAAASLPGGDKLNIMFSVYDGQVYTGTETLPGHVDTSSGLVLNRQALEDFEKAARHF